MHTCSIYIIVFIKNNSVQSAGKLTIIRKNTKYQIYVRILNKIKEKPIYKRMLKSFSVNAW